MAGDDDGIRKIAEDLKGRKAKVKDLEGKPEGTKAAKLPNDVRKALEDHFGANLGGVKVHVGGNVPELAKELGARSFAIGTDIYFSKPSDAKNSELLAHELTHIIQQGGGKIPAAKDGKALTSK